MAGGELMVQESRPALQYDMMSMAMTAQSVKSQVQLIQTVMRDVMKKGEHWGLIPGCGDKPALLKAGAEKLMMTFHLAPSFKIAARELPQGHREYEVVCEIMSPTGQFLGAGVGLCSSMESKYRWRNAQRQCPKCHKEAIIKGKAQYGGGWVCFDKKGGCGAKFPDGSPDIENQSLGRVENPDIADQFNTVLKMAKKRALVDATLTVTAASDIFTQDIEEGADTPQDDPHGYEQGNPPPPPQNSSRGNPRGQQQPPQQGTRSRSSGRAPAQPAQQAQHQGGGRQPMNQMEEPWQVENPATTGEFMDPPAGMDGAPAMDDPNHWPKDGGGNRQGGFIPATTDQIEYIRNKITALNLGATWARELEIACPGADGQALSKTQAARFADHLDILAAKQAGN